MLNAPPQCDFPKKGNFIYIDIDIFIYILDGRLYNVLFKREIFPILSGLFYILLWIRYPNNK